MMFLSSAHPIRSISVWLVVVVGFAALPWPDSSVRTTVSAQPSDTVGGVLQASPVVIRDIATDATDKNNESDAEPSIAVNPVNPSELTVVAFSGVWGDAPTGAAPVWKSFDGGGRWEKLPLLPAPTRMKFAPPIDRLVELAGPNDWNLVYDDRGHLIVAAMGSDKISRDDPFSVNVLYRQTGGPRDALSIDSIFGEGYLDQPMLGYGAGGGCTARTYAAWRHSKDETSMINVDVVDAKAVPTRTARIATDSSASAYVLYKVRTPSSSDVESVSYRVRRSDDCGRTWTALGTPAGVAVHNDRSTVTSLFTPNFGKYRWPRPNEPVQARAMSSDGWITVHGPTGKVYVAYVALADNGRSQIFVTASSDRGIHWTDSRRVTDSKAMAAYPEIAVNQDGVIAVLYVDYEGTIAKSFRHQLALSADEGASWKYSTLQTLNPDVLTNDWRDIRDLWGDYGGLTSHDSTFYGVFAGESIARPRKQLDPIFFKLTANRRVTSPPPPPPPPPPNRREYQIVRGDSLWRIARRQTKQGHNWPELYRRNRTRIGANPNRIRVGRSLQLPW